MSVVAILALLVLCLAVVAAADSRRVIVEGKLVIPDGSSASSIKVSLNGNEYFATTNRNGDFSFREVPSGIYLLDVLDTTRVFSQVSLD